MKYQKSMLKIYELLLDREFIIEDLIKKASVGRTEGFKAIKYLEDKGFANIRMIGRQKQVSLKRDEYSFRFKSFIDSMKFKELDNSLKYSINLFISSIKDRGIRSVLLFGSSLFNDNPKDIDLLIVSDEIDKNEINKIRDNVELLTNFVINLHFDNKPSNETLLNSVCLYGFDNYLKLLIKEDRIKVQFSEAINWIISSYNNIKDKRLFNECFENSIINLGFSYSFINHTSLKTKEEAKLFLFKKYHKLNKSEGLNNYDKFKLAKEVASEIGKEIFR